MALFQSDQLVESSSKKVASRESIWVSGGDRRVLRWYQSDEEGCGARAKAGERQRSREKVMMWQNFDAVAGEWLSVEACCLGVRCDVGVRDFGYIYDKNDAHIQRAIPTTFKYKVNVLIGKHSNTSMGSSHTNLFRLRINLSLYLLLADTR